MSELVVKEEVSEVEVITLENCIIKYKSGTLTRNEAIYEASQLSEEEWNNFVDVLGLGSNTIFKALAHEKAKISLSLPISVMNSLSLDFGVYSCLKGSTPEEHEDNFQEIYLALEKERLPKSYEIEMYNALKSSATVRERVNKLPYVFKHISKGSSSLKRKFRSGNSFKLEKLYKAIQHDADEAVLIGIADTGNSIPTKSSPKDKDKIKELTEEIEVLNRRLDFFTTSLPRDRLKKFMDTVDYTIKMLKKIGGDDKLMEALRLLNVDITVSESELKKAYKQKVSIHHPDADGDADMFIKIVDANKYIKNRIQGMLK